MDRSTSVADGCPECARLLSEYEAATFEQSKIHNALNIANHLRDRDGARRLTLDAYDVTARQRKARAALAEHHAAVHQTARVLTH
jgi:hypothetical protein